MPLSAHSSRCTCGALSRAGLRDLLEEALRDQWRDWREERDRARVCLSVWFRAPAGERGRAYRGYREALDREEQAAEVLRGLFEEARGRPQA